MLNEIFDVLIIFECIIQRQTKRGEDFPILHHEQKKEINSVQSVV